MTETATKPVYTVSNFYGVSGTSNHRTAEAACKAARKREGDGWIVKDQDGDQWTMYPGADRAFSV